MTSVEARLRETLQAAGSGPVGTVDFDALSRRRRNRRITRWVASAASASALAGVLVWTLTAGAGNGVATVIPAAPAGDGIGVLIAPEDRQAAPELAGSTLTGTQFELGAARGRVSVVNFCGSWSAPCRNQASKLRNLPDTLTIGGSHGTPVRFIGVDVRESLQNARDYFVRDQRINYPIVIDTNRNIASAWTLKAVPYTVVVDRQGRIAARFEGITGTALTNAIDRVASEPLPVTVGLAKGHIELGNGDYSIDPAAAAKTPADVAVAWKRVSADLPNGVCNGARMTVLYGLFTMYRPDSSQPAGRTPSEYDHVPEWVVRCADVGQIFSGAPGLPLGRHAPSASPRELQPALIDNISVFDAKTGKLLIGFTESAS